MPNWRDLMVEVKATPAAHDQLRQKYLQKLFQYTHRNAIVYYSGWQDKNVPADVGRHVFPINDADKNGFMTAIHGMNRALGLDLFLHTPGGDIAATESIVHYLRTMFGNNIRAVVPQMAMSGGTMIAKYHPTLISQCQLAIDWSEELVRNWLCENMFSDYSDADSRAQRVVDGLTDQSKTKSHTRHVHADVLSELGLDITPLEQDQELQDLVLSVHHALKLTLSTTGAFKIIENHMGVAHMISLTRPPQ